MRKYLSFILVLILKTTLFFSQGANKSKWLGSEAPNYKANVNLYYPYSNQEYACAAVSPIPSSDSYIPLIDFYGEGRIVDNDVVSGFKDAYNINHQYQLVSNGPDLDRRIPNRIPVPNYSGDLGLSRYVSNDRVSAITLMGAPIQQNTAQEMVRMIRKDGLGKIIIFGFDDSSSEVALLEKELKKIEFYLVPNSILEPPFNEIKGFSDHPRVYKGKKVKVIGEKVFCSLNPKNNLDVSQQDMLTLDYSSLTVLNADLSGGIKGTIDKPGGLIKVEVFAYDHYENDGIQKLYSTVALSQDKLVYGAYTDVSNIDNYVEKTTTIPYGFDRNLDGSYRVLGETRSNNIKLLGADSRSGWFDSECRWIATRFFRWLGWKVMSVFYSKVPEECQSVLTKIQSGRQPVLVKVTIKDATLYDYKVPGLINGSIVNFVEDEKVQEYKIIKNLKVTILESPKEFKKATFYKKQLENAIIEANRYYTKKTGHLKNPEITAEIGNPRILFKNVTIILKKGSRESYNFLSDMEVDKLLKETELEDNDDETIQLIYVHTVLSTNPRNPQEYPIRGYTYNEGDVISSDHFCIFSYDVMFDVDPDLVGTQGSTMAHELGHYFGLLHPFSGGCSKGDGISDTPPTEGEYWYTINSGTPQEKLLENPCENAPHSCNGERRQIENIMDYGPCRWLFTKEQTEQMIRRIETNPKLFNTVMVYDASVDPDKISIVIDDQRLDNNDRRKRSVTNDAFSIRMLYPNAQIDYYNLEVTSDKPEKATIRMFDIYTNQVYEKYISVEKGQNHFPIESRFLNGNGLYLLTYNSDDGRTEKIKFLRSQ